MVKIDVNIVNSILSAVKNSFKVITNLDLKIEKPKVIKEIEKEYDVVTNIGFTGVLEGNIVYSFSQEVALALVSDMMQGMMEVKELDDMAISAIGELGNMVSGSIATYLEQLGYLISVTPPSILRGKIVKVSVRGTILLFPIYVSEKNEMDLYFVFKEKK
ncbi:chemotaxis protein CheX [Petrotoga sp. 9PWA.NaAc.5.4]|uniref:chemotaxis protein CheX n=1 Tax=Petrotoga sp. 9PWA.NaAc.5.4 TaxID=1434328 RepID=UPI001E304755|nr:chemotaxis protein CheX [Petrotoga sp. 9PWA.NaAc.5.4]